MKALDIRGFVIAVALIAALGVGILLGLGASAPGAGWSVFFEDGWHAPWLQLGPFDGFLVATAAIVAVVVAVPLAVAFVLLAVAVAIGAVVAAVGVVVLVTTSPLWLIALAVWAVVRASRPRPVRPT
jgi:hypothetical protein